MAPAGDETTSGGTSGSYNSSSTASDDEVTTTEWQSVVINVIKNDSDPDGVSHNIGGPDTYPRVVKSWEDNIEHMLRFMEYPESIWSVIYTIN